MQNKLGAKLRNSAILALLSGISFAQSVQAGRILTIQGQSGEAPVVEVGGRAYVDIETLTRILHGSLSFRANRVILSFPASHDAPSGNEDQPAQSNPTASNAGLSQSFMRAGIEVMADIREWASTLGYAIQNGYQVTEDWAANYREQAANNLRLASAATSTEADRNAFQLLSNEFEAVRDWSNRLIQERKSMDTAKYALSPNALRDDSQSQKIITCGHFLATMLGSASFQDDPSCH
jgi:hypothetical protein